MRLIRWSDLCDIIRRKLVQLPSITQPPRSCVIHGRRRDGRRSTGMSSWAIDLHRKLDLHASRLDPPYGRHGREPAFWARQAPKRIRTCG